MLKEMPFISENLNQNGLKEGDFISFRPFLSKSKEICLNRTCIDFVTEDVLEQETDVKFAKVLDSVGGESLFLRMEVLKTMGQKGHEFDRYFVKALKGGPFVLNGNLVFSSFLERGDCLEIGHNKLEFKKNIRSLNMSSQKKLIQENLKAIKSPLSILVEGETGTGKTSLAKQIHETSARFGKFVHLNLAAFSPNLLESELFGHSKGAFTGATADKKGAIEEAKYGTLFIDEIDSLPLEIQLKLLLFLDDHIVRPVGSNKSIQVDVRLIFSSGKPLEDLVCQGKMRKDFFFRITTGVGFKLPSLRDDTSLIRSFCQYYGVNHQVSIHHKLIEFYETMPWPGNYRQLKSHLDLKCVISKSTKLIFDQTDESLIKSSSSLTNIDQDFKEDESLELNKLNYVRAMYFKYNQDYKKTATALKVSEKSVRRYIKDLTA